MRCEKLLFGLPWYFLVGCIMVPVFWSIGPWTEKKFFPVIRNVQVGIIDKTDSGAMIQVRFDKVRECEFTALVWYKDGVRIGVDLDPGEMPTDQYRTEGEHIMGPWMLDGVATLDGTTAAAMHRCHPLWPTVSHFYP